MVFQLNCEFIFLPISFVLYALFYLITLNVVALITQIQRNEAMGNCSSADAARVFLNGKSGIEDQRSKIEQI
jgi:hypothetical protein